MDLALPERFGLVIFCGLVGLFGGGIRAALRKDPEMSPIRDVLTNAAASGFAAFICALAMLDIWPTGRDYLVMAVSGVIGWAGAKTLDATTAGATGWLGKLLGRSFGQEPGGKP